MSGYNKQAVERLAEENRQLRAALAAAAPAQGALTDARCALRGGKCSCPTACERNMQAARSGQVSDAADAARLDWVEENCAGEIQRRNGSLIMWSSADPLRGEIDAAIQAQAADAKGGA